MTAAIIATALGATAGAVTSGPASTQPAAIGVAAVAPDASTDARASRSRVRITDQASAAPGSGSPTAGAGLPAGPPTGTPTAGGPGSALPSATARLAAAPPPAAPPVATPPRTPAAPATGDATGEAAVLTLVNQERAKAGCQPVGVDARLTAAARAHSTDMATRNYFAHDTPDGVAVGTRVTKAGYRWSLVGENIAKGQPDAAAVMTAWMNSPGHRANILNCRFTNIGIGVAHQGRTPLWTQDFGTPL